MIVFLTLYYVIASGYTPPGIGGEVLRHNQRYNIDASPLFYTEVENMSELEIGLKKLLSKSKNISVE
jgi:hypothetical protein